jgi:hypothetical protein
MSNISVNTITDASGGSTASINGLTPQASNMAATFNRIINGAMTISQRNTSYTPSGSGDYGCVDRWNARAASGGSPTVSQSSTAPTGFINSLLFTTGTGVSPAAGDRNWLRQPIEGFNIADLAWGTANAQTITVSFQVRSSLTGTFAAAVVNDNGDRAWPFTFTISLANTFETKSATITGPTDGTWGSGNDVGLSLNFDMGCGSTYEGTAGQWNNSNKLTVSGATQVIATSGATFYITGVQLEAGSTASSFAYEFVGGTLQKCQRYFETQYFNSLYLGIGQGSHNLRQAHFSVTKRAVPTLTTAFSVDAGAAVTATSPDKGGYRYGRIADNSAIQGFMGTLSADAEL